LENSFKDSRLYGFFCELRRRKVYRVSAGYGVVGWLMMYRNTGMVACAASGYIIRCL
jgi:hypothetical protein